MLNLIFCKTETVWIDCQDNIFCKNEEAWRFIELMSKQFEMASLIFYVKYIEQNSLICCLCWQFVNIKYIGNQLEHIFIILPWK